MRLDDGCQPKAEELRAKTIVLLTDIPNVGHFYTFQSPQGAIVSVIGHWQVRRCW